ncbi:MAG: hypothetical protein IT435_03445, partial [Phycisphaerales bacterium]|nr:hypothetical protein [Phycisphaerales bacterium]
MPFDNETRNRLLSRRMERDMNKPRREFLVNSARAIELALGLMPTVAAFGRQEESPPNQPGPTTRPRKVVRISVKNGDELQTALDRHAGAKVTLRIDRPTSLVCREREARIGEELSRHPLLLPEGVELDLGDSTLLLDLRSNCYGIRLSNGSGICNGTVRIIRSENKGSQGIWHCAVCVGAAYDDGGTPERPSRFSVVSGWRMENLTIEQPFAACAIQLMSEAHHGLIHNIRILDSEKALLGVGMDWGSVGPIRTPDEEIPRMRQLWEQGKIYSTHPHDVLVENIQVGRLGRNVDGNDAGVRCSACHNITIRNVRVDSAATGVAIWGGDCGYEYAPDKHRDLGHSGYVIDGLTIAKALRYGIVLNGSADNVHRSRLKYGYDSLRDPNHPGINHLLIRNTQLRGGAPKAQGLY